MSMELAFKITACAAAFYAAICLFAYFFADRIAFPAPRPSYAFRPDEGFVFLDTAEGDRICALGLENPVAKHTILYSHGNGEDLGEIRPRLEEIRDMGFSVLAYDYLGYGQSGGKMGAAKVYPCAEAAWKFLTEEKRISPENIAVWGYSMGSAASTWLAAEKKPRALVLVGGFASAIRAVLPVNILPWDMLDNERAIGNAECPAMILHGTKDRVVPFRNAKRLEAAAKGPKKLFAIRGAGHYDVAESAPGLYYGGIKGFIETLQFPEGE